MQLYRTYNDWSIALVEISFLEFYDLHPFVPDEAQCRLNPFKIIAFGGIRVFLPADEIASAEMLFSKMQEFAASDYDVIEPIIWSRKFGTFLFSGHTVFSLVIFIPPIFVALIWISLAAFVTLLSMIQAISLNFQVLWWWLLGAGLLCIPLHAQYIAIPALRRQKDAP